MCFGALRHQLPAYSPLSFGAIAGAALASAGRGAQERAQAAALVARETRADRVVLLDSGRAALQVAIQLALHVRGGTAVALPGYQCYELASAAVGAECGIALYDVDPGTLAPDLASVEALLRGGVRAVVLAPLYGFVFDWDETRGLLDRYGAVAIVDAAQAHGAEWRGEPVATLADLSVLSFVRGKGWTGGAGGALCLRGDMAAHSAVAHSPAAGAAGGMRVALGAVAQWAAGRPCLYGVPASVPWLELGETVYHAPTPPAGMAAYSAALLRRTHRHAGREASVRQDTAAFWRANLPESVAPGLVTPLPNTRPGYLRFPVRLLQGRGEAEALLGGPARRAGVMRAYPKPLSALAAVAARRVLPGRLPGAEGLADGLVTLPTHSWLGPQDRGRVLAAIRGRGGAPATRGAKRHL